MPCSCRFIWLTHFQRANSNHPSFISFASYSSLKQLCLWAYGYNLKKNFLENLSGGKKRNFSFLRYFSWCLKKTSDVSWHPVHALLRSCWMPTTRPSAEKRRSDVRSVAGTAAWKSLQVRLHGHFGWEALLKQISWFSPLTTLSLRHEVPRLQPRAAWGELEECPKSKWSSFKSVHLVQNQIK